MFRTSGYIVVKKEHFMIATYQRIKQHREAQGIDSGFTLIELLIVIVVLGILAAIVVFSLGTITGKSALAACEADAQQLNTGLAAFYAGTQTYPAQLAPGTTANTGDGFQIMYPVGMAPSYLQTLPDNKSHYFFAYSAANTPGAIYQLWVANATPPTTLPTATPITTGGWQLISTDGSGTTFVGVGATTACTNAKIT